MGRLCRASNLSWTFIYPSLNSAAAAAAASLRRRRLASSDGALHADTAVTINGGKLTVTASDEGIESAAGEALL